MRRGSIVRTLDGRLGIIEDIRNSGVPRLAAEIEVYLAGQSEENGEIRNFQKGDLEVVGSFRLKWRTKAAAVFLYRPPFGLHSDIDEVFTVSASLEQTTPELRRIALFQLQQVFSI